MKRTLLLFALVAGVLAVPATASAFSGVVIAKTPARHAIVVASRGGVIRTVRAPKRLGSIRLGQRLVFSARRLSDGTFKAGALRRRGRARGATVRGVVVRHRGSSYLLSAGGSMLAVHVSARGFAMAGSRGHRAGDIVSGRVRISSSGLVTKGFHSEGHTNATELEGIYLGMTDSGQLRLAVRHKGEVFVTVPDGFQLPALAPGDEIELVVSVGADGSFTLVSLQQDDENDNDHEGIDEHQGKIEVDGMISDLTETTITVQSHEASPVTCNIPPGMSVAGFAVNDRVEMKCRLVDGQLMLVKLEHEDGDNGDGDDDGGGGDHEG
jgi:hypothetical protein